MIAYTAAIAFYPALGWNTFKRFSVLIALCSIILLSPLLISANHPFLRFTAAFNTTALVLKLYDLHAHTGREGRMRLAAFVAYLPNCFNLVPRKNPRNPRLCCKKEVRRITEGVATLGGSIALMTILFQINWRPYPLIWEHSVKVMALYLVVASAGKAGAATWRILGSGARELMAQPFLSPTPAEFWRRYNRPFQQFFYENVFKPSGGIHSPIRATFLTFAISAIIHEYIFDIAVGYVQGYQAAFFLLQGCAVAVTLSLKPTGWRKFLYIGLNTVFMLLSSVLFFLSVNSLLPFYDHRATVFAVGN